MEQQEVAPGIWLPTRYQYDFTARKFLFTFEQHQYVEAQPVSPHRAAQTGAGHGAERTGQRQIQSTETSNFSVQPGFNLIAMGAQ